jgi:DNA helicase IV
MHVGGIRQFAARISTRSTRMALVGCILMAVPVTWMVRQSWLTHEALQRATTAEKVAAQAQSDVEQARAQLETGGKPRKDPAIRRSRHDDPREIARVKKLYEEVDTLSRIQESVEDELTGIRRIAAKRAAEATAPAPAHTP